MNDMDYLGVLLVWPHLLVWVRYPQSNNGDSKILLNSSSQAELSLIQFALIHISSEMVFSVKRCQILYILTNS